MPIKDFPYEKLEPLLVDNLSTEEDEETLELIKNFRPAKKRGWLTKDELIKICYWKSARPINRIKANSTVTIRRITEAAFKSRSERFKIEELTKLDGVSIPMASSILMFINPKRYGVIDIRVWEIFYKLGIMQTNPKGINFKFNEWYRYLVILRYFANKLDVTARNIERTIFLAHQKHQDGLLYSNLIAPKKVGALLLKKVKKIKTTK